MRLIVNRMNLGLINHHFRNRMSKIYNLNMSKFFNKRIYNTMKARVKVIIKTLYIIKELSEAIS